MEILQNTTFTLDANNSVLNSSEVFSGNESYVYEETVSVSSSNNIKIANTIINILYPLLVFFGTIGNLLSIYVLRRGSLKNVSTCFYMSILAIADTCFLWSGAFGGWLYRITDGEINVFIFADCKVIYFLFYFSAHYSSALLVVMSLEKVFALYFPLKARSICTVKTARWASLVAGIIMFAYNAQNFFNWDKRTQNGISSCVFIHTNYYDLFSQINSVIWSFGPFTIIFLANSAICYKFMMAKWESRQSGTESTNQALSKNAFQGTAMLITVSFVFILFNGPSALLRYVGDWIWSQTILIRVIGFLQYVNYSINTILYCIVGTRFRREFVNMICCRRKSIFHSGSVPPKSLSRSTGSARLSSVVSHSIEENS